MTKGCGAVLEWRKKGGRDGAACINTTPHAKDADAGHVWDRDAWPNRSEISGDAGRLQEAVTRNLTPRGAA